MRETNNITPAVGRVITFKVLVIRKIGSTCIPEVYLLITLVFVNILEMYFCAPYHPRAAGKMPKL